MSAGAAISAIPYAPEGALYKDAIVPATNSNGQSILAKIPTFQLLMMNYVNGTATVPLSTITQTLFNSTGNGIGIINRGLSSRITDAHIEMNIQVAGGPVQLTNTMGWFSRLDIYQTANTAFLASMYPDSKLTWIQMMTHMGDLASYLRMMNANNRPGCLFGLTPQLFPTSNSYPFYYPLSETFLNRYLAFWFSGANTDLALQFTVPPTIIAVNPGSAGSITLLSMRVILQTQDLSPRDYQIENADAAKYGFATNYLDPIIVHPGPMQFTAGQQTNIDLSTVSGRVVQLATFIRGTTFGGAAFTNTGNAWINNILCMGDNATVQLVNGAQEPINTSGTPWRLSYNGYELFSDQSRNDTNVRFPGPIYMSLGDSMQQAYAGQGPGLLPMANNQHNLIQITPVRGVNEVQTITKATAAYTAGFYRLGVSGYTDQTAPLQFNASVATMKAAFEALEPIYSQGITVTFSATLSAAGTTITATLNTPRTNGLEGQLIQVYGDNLNASGTQDAPTTALTTKGIAGLVTDGTYDVIVVALVYRQVLAAGGVLSMNVLDPNQA